MSTLFGRSKKHRSRTISSASDTLDGSSVPYASTTQPNAPPTPRRTNGLASPALIGVDGSFAAAQNSYASGSGYTTTNARAASVYSVASQHSGSSSSRPLSPPLNSHITAPIHLIPESRPYNDYSVRSQTPDVLYNDSDHQARLRHQRSSVSEGQSHASSSSARSPTKSQSLRRPNMDRLQSEEEQRRRRTAAASGSSRGFDADMNGGNINVYSDHNGNMQARRDSVASTTPYSPSSRSLPPSASPYIAHYPYSQSQSSANPSYSPGLTSSSASIRTSRTSVRSVISRKSSVSLSQHHASILPPVATPNLASSEFYFPRPSKDSEIEEKFALLLERKVPFDKHASMASFPIAKKWAMVYNDALQEWKQNRAAVPPSSDALSPPMSSPTLSVNEGSYDANLPAINMIAATNSANSILRASTQTPQWYLGKIMHGTIQPSEVSSLTVALRTYELAWVKEFIVAYKGLPALTSALASITRLPLPLSDHHAKLELELAKCLKTLLGIKLGADEAMSHPISINEIALAMVSSNIACRKLVIDMLTFLAYWNDHQGHQYVLRALDSLMNAKGEKARFDAWFTILEATIDGRGKMGSLVGASDEVRTLRSREALQQSQSNATTASGGSILNEYTLVNLWLVNAISLLPPDYQVRVHLRQQMEHAGLGRILVKMRTFKHPQIDIQIKQYEEQAEEDYQRVVENFEQDILRDFKDPWDVFRALLSSVEGTRAHDFFVSAMQHLLLIREEGEARVRYFQLIDSVITSIVLDRKGVERDFSEMLGFSVSTLISKFANEDRLADLEDQVDQWHRQASKLRREKADLADELSKRDDGLVGEMNQKLYRLEEDLAFSRQATDLLRQKIHEQESASNEKIAQAELFSQELFNMLKESRGLEGLTDDTNLVDRGELVGLMEKKMERIKTIERLEGRHLSKAAPPGITESLRSRQGSHKWDKTTIRRSAFEDADDQAVRAHIEASLAAGASNLSPLAERHPGVTPQSTRPRDRARGTPSPSGIDRSKIVYSPSGLQSPLSTVGQLDKAGTAETRLLPQRNLSENSEDAPRTPTATARFGAKALPTNLLASLRARASPANSSADDTVLPLPADSPSRQPLSPTTPDRPAKSHKRRPTEDDVPPSSVASDIQNDTSTAIAVPPPPPAPPAPPRPPISGEAMSAREAPAPTSSGSLPPPPPPPPPPLPAGLLSGIISATDGPGSMAAMLKARKVALVPNAKIVDGDAVVGPAGSKITHPERGLWVPPPPGAKVAVPTPPSSGLMKPAIARKDQVVTAKRQLKQVVWEKVNPTQLTNTIWVVNNVDELELASKLTKEGIFDQIEEDFKTKAIGNKVAKKKRDDLKSVLDDKKRERIEILIRKHSAKDDVQAKILDVTERLLTYDEILCSEHFLGELKPMLPTPDLVGKLNQHKTDDDADLALLAHADRFLVELMKIKHLPIRVEGMLYRAKFQESQTSLLQQAKQLNRACESLREARHFGQLLKLILLLGNFMNAQGYNGGAFGFKINSINRLVDTKSASGQSLLHTLERTITTKFPDMTDFIQELADPIEAYRINLSEVRKGLTELRGGLDSVTSALREHFDDYLDDLESRDAYPRKMFRFIRDASLQVQALEDRVTLADSAFSGVVTYFGADESISSNEFFGNLNTFVSSYKRAQADNEAALKQQVAAEKRRAARDAAKGARAPKAAETPSVPVDGQIMEDLFSRLREGRAMGRTRARKAHGERLQKVQSPTPQSTSFERTNTAEAALGLLAQLRGSGFEDVVPSQPARSQRRTRQPLSFVASRPNIGASASAATVVTATQSTEADLSKASTDDSEATESQSETASSDSEDSDDRASPTPRKAVSSRPIAEVSDSDEDESQSITSSLAETTPVVQQSAAFRRESQVSASQTAVNEIDRDADEGTIADTSLIVLDEDALAIARLA